MTDQVAQFWGRARAELAANAAPGTEVPIAWSFGATPAHADELLGLVLSGVKTGTASALWDYEETDEPVPVSGELSIILDGCGCPKALIRTTSVRIHPFDEVSEEHAFSEGEGDRTLPGWRAGHEKYWRNHMVSRRGFAKDMPVVCERFELLYAE